MLRQELLLQAMLRGSLLVLLHVPLRLWLVLLQVLPLQEVLRALLPALLPAHTVASCFTAGAAAYSHAMTRESILARLCCT